MQNTYPPESMESDAPEPEPGCHTREQVTGVVARLRAKAADSARGRLAELRSKDELTLSEADELKRCEAAVRGDWDAVGRVRPRCEQPMETPLPGKGDGRPADVTIAVSGMSSTPNEQTTGVSGPNTVEVSHPDETIATAGGKPLVEETANSEHLEPEPKLSPREERLLSLRNTSNGFYDKDLDALRYYFPNPKYMGPYLAWVAPLMKPMDTVLFLHLCRLKGKNSRVYPAYVTLGNQLGVSKNTVEKSARRLAQVGLVRIEHRHGTSQQYHIAEIFEDKVLVDIILMAREQKGMNAVEDKEALLSRLRTPKNCAFFKSTNGLEFFYPDPLTRVGPYMAHLLRHIKPSHTLVFLDLSRREKIRQPIDVSYREITQSTGLTKNTIATAIKFLQRVGLVDTDRSSGHNFTFVVTDLYQDENVLRVLERLEEGDPPPDESVPSEATVSGSDDQPTASAIVAGEPKTGTVTAVTAEAEDRKSNPEIGPGQPRTGSSGSGGEPIIGSNVNTQCGTTQKTRGSGLRPTHSPTQPSNRATLPLIVQPGITGTQFVQLQLDELCEEKGSMWKRAEQVDQILLDASHHLVPEDVYEMLIDPDQGDMRSTKQARAAALLTSVRVDEVEDVEHWIRYAKKRHKSRKGCGGLLFEMMVRAQSVPGSRYPTIFRNLLINKFWPDFELTEDFELAYDVVEDVEDFYNDNATKLTTFFSPFDFWDELKECEEKGPNTPETRAAVDYLVS